MRALALFAAGVLLLAGLGSSAGETKPRVWVAMTSKACRVAPTDVAVGKTLFRVVNHTQHVRAFKILAHRTPYLPPGASARLPVTFERAGTYRFSCVSRGARAMARTGVVAVHPVASERTSPPSSL